MKTLRKIFKCLNTWYDQLVNYFSELIRKNVNFL